MPFYKFGEKDVLRNRIKTKPKSTFVINSGTVYYSDRNNISGQNVSNVQHIPTGYISLYGLNVDRDFSKHTYDPDTDTGVKAKIFPFITKNSSLNSFSTTSTNAFNQFVYGAIMTGSYPMSSSITVSSSVLNAPRAHINALKNTFNYYTSLSPQYAFSSSLYGDKATQALQLISIPSVFYGSSMVKNSVKLNFYVSGTLVATCEDKNRNGELIQTSGSVYAQSQGSGLTAGLVLYNEGFIVLTGSWSLTEQSFDFGAGGAHVGTWLDFAAEANTNSGDPVTPSASFDINFDGTNYINTISMMADAPLGELNFTPNPTFKDYSIASSSNVSQTGPRGYYQNSDITIKNTMSSSFCNTSASFERQTFISKIGVYDKDKNLIAVANLSKPIKKTPEKEYTFRLKLDI